MAIRAVIFDLYGVLVRTRGHLELTWERLGLPKGGFSKALSEHPMLHLSIIGKATRKEAFSAFWVDLQDQFSLTDDQLKELQSQSSGAGWDEKLLAFIRALRPAYKTGVISNGWLDTREQHKEQVNDDTFDVIVISAEEGVAKPDPTIYWRALSLLGVAPEEAIYVDDLLPFVQGAQAVGIHAIHFTDSAQARAEITHLLDTEP